MNVTVQLPGALAGYAGGRREVPLEFAARRGGGPAADNADTGAADLTDAAGAAGAAQPTLAEVLDCLGDQLPALERRIRDERAAIRRHVNVYVDGTDVRALSGLETPVPDHAVIDVIAAVSGG